jgi:hypothetical protein
MEYKFEVHNTGKVSSDWLLVASEDLRNELQKFPIHPHSLISWFSWRNA